MWLNSSSYAYDDCAVCVCVALWCGAILRGRYGTAGYIVKNISTTAAELRAVFAELEAEDWISAQTRAVIFDVNIWNPSQRCALSLFLQQFCFPCHVL